MGLVVKYSSGTQTSSSTFLQYKLDFNETLAYKDLEDWIRTKYDTVDIIDKYYKCTTSPDSDLVALYNVYIKYKYTSVTYRYE